MNKYGFQPPQTTDLDDAFTPHTSFTLQCHQCDRGAMDADGRGRGGGVNPLVGGQAGAGVRPRGGGRGGAEGEGQDSSINCEPRCLIQVWMIF